jgi:hypothetical protein
VITGTLLALLGFALAVVLWAMFRTPSNAPKQVPGAKPPAIKPAVNPLDVDVWDAQKGDVISITGAAEDFSDLDFAVDRRSAYQGSVQRWIDLSGEFRGQRVYLEVYRHPQPDLLGILDPRKLGIADIGVSENQLADFDTRQDPSVVIEFEGKKWNWESSREIRYFENETGSGEGLYRWLFREPGGARLICIEKWEGEPFEVRIARRLNQRDVTVYRGTRGA